jgi:hypothetical protein
MGSRSPRLASSMIFFGYLCRCGIIAIDQTQLTQRLFERHPKHSDSLRPEGFSFRLERNPNRHFRIRALTHAPPAGSAPMESYHTGYKFGGGPRNEAHVPKFRPPSLSPRVFPKLPASQVGTIARRRSASTPCQTMTAGVAPSLAGEARVPPWSALFNGKQLAVALLVGETARRCVSHQALVAAALLRVSCLRIQGGRARGNPNFDPRPCPPGFFPSCGKLGWGAD